MLSYPYSEVLIGLHMVCQPESEVLKVSGVLLAGLRHFLLEAAELLLDDLVEGEELVIESVCDCIYVVGSPSHSWYCLPHR